MKKQILDFIKANNKINSDAVVEKFNLKRSVVKDFGNGIAKVAYHTQDGEFIMELREAKPDQVEQKYINYDERLGSTCKFTMAEMIAQYRECGWDYYMDANSDSQKMTDQEIIDDVLKHDVEEI